MSSLFRKSLGKNVNFINSVRNITSSIPLQSKIAASWSRKQANLTLRMHTSGNSLDDKMNVNKVDNGNLEHDHDHSHSHDHDHDDKAPQEETDEDEMEEMFQAGPSLGINY